MNYDAERVNRGIAEVDTISLSGIPKRKLTLVVATTSSGQTDSFACRYRERSG